MTVVDHQNPHRIQPGAECVRGDHRPLKHGPVWSRGDVGSILQDESRHIAWVFDVELQLLARGRLEPCGINRRPLLGISIGQNKQTRTLGGSGDGFRRGVETGVGPITSCQHAIEVVVGAATEHQIQRGGVGRDRRCQTTRRQKD